MKIRANLNFFLSKRGGSLARLCENSGIKTREELLGFLDDACVAHPDEEALALLFPARQKSLRRAVRKSAAVTQVKQVKTVTVKSHARDALENPQQEGAPKPKGKSKRSSRRKSRNLRSTSASEE